MLSAFSHVLFGYLYIFFGELFIHDPLPIKLKKFFFESKRELGRGGAEGEIERNLGRLHARCSVEPSEGVHLMTLRS